MSLGISVNVEHWDEAKQLISDECEDSRKLQLIIDSKIAEFDKKIKRLEVLDMAITFETLLDTNSRKAPNQTVTPHTRYYRVDQR